MSDTKDIDALLGRIRDAMTAHAEQPRPVENTRSEYKRLLAQFARLEKRYVSDHGKGYLKGLLFNHNKANHANLTSLFIMKGQEAIPLVYAGDTILLNAIPELIGDRTSHETGATVLVELGGTGPTAFSLALKKMEVSEEIIYTAAVTSSPHFNIRNFEYVSGLLCDMYRKNRDLGFPVMLDYIHDVSTEISRLCKTRDGAMHADHFILYSPPETFARAGIYNLIEFSKFVVQTLKSTYPPAVNVFIVSPSNYVVLYDDDIKQGLDIKRNRIDFFYHGNNIPYKVLMHDIDSPQSLFVFLDSL